MSKIKILLKYLLGFITSISLAIIILLFLLKFTVGNKEYMLSNINENNYYEKIDSEIKEEMKLYLLSTGFTEDIVKDVYTKDELIKDINYYIDNMYNGHVTILDKTNIKNNIEEKIEIFFLSNNLEMTNKKDLNSFVNDLVNIYKNEVCLYGYLDDVVVHLNKINSLLDKTLLFLCIFLLMIIIIQLIIRKTFISSSIIASGLIILFINLFVFEKIDIENILIITENFSILLETFFSNIKSLFTIFGIILIILGTLVLIIKIMCQPKKKKLLEY